MIVDKQQLKHALHNGTSEHLRSARGYGQESQQDDEANENDEENIVIDMADEDDEPEGDDAFEPSGVQLPGEHAAIKLTTSGKTITTRQPDNNEQELAAKLREFQEGELVWFDPNGYGYLIPGKVIDYYPQPTPLLTVEGCVQPAPRLGQEAQRAQTDEHEAALDDDGQLQCYYLSDIQQLSSVRRRAALKDEQGERDLVELSELSWESIVWNLRLRFKQELVYTKCGHRILISVNPQRQLANMYNLDQVSRYDSLVNVCKLSSISSPEVKATGSSRRRYKDTEGLHFSSNLIRWLLLSEQPAEREPHIFGMANEALKELLISGQDQSFILLGQSGSGKTEVSKLLAQYLSTVNKSPSNLMTEQILESIQVLESFGNARTVHNDNSSRFGKLLEIRFNLANGFIKDARINDLHLLDRTRIVSQSERERNFHVFYELLAGLNDKEKEKYGLQTADKYFYLNQGRCVHLENKEDGDDFRSLLAAMQVLGFNYEEQDTIFRLLASVLHLGNIYFHRKVLAVRSAKLVLSQPAAEPVAAGGQQLGVEGVEIGSNTEVRWVSHLLQIQFDSVLRCLTMRTTESPAGQHVVERIVSPLNIDQALDTRDAIARALYTCLFRWLVQRINAMISQQVEPEHTTNSKQSEPIYLCRTSESLCEFQPDRLVAEQQSSLRRAKRNQLAKEATVSILDAFGFENLPENNFEQLCINYAAELVQHHCQRYLLRLEQAEYARERLVWAPMTPGGCQQTPSSSSLLRAKAAGSSLSGTQSSGQAPAAGALVNLLSRKPLGILALLDDECNFPKATDQSFVEKCHHNHTLNENYQRARLASNSQEFGVRHFGQPNRLVWYQVDGFIEKNRDFLRPDIMDLLLSSRMLVVADMLRKMQQESGRQSGSRTLGRAMKPRATTLATRFQDALQHNRALEAINGPALELPLSASSERPQPWFVFCLQPTAAGSPSGFDVHHVEEQARTLSLLEAVQIRKSGYPIRLRFNEFLRRYKCLVASKFLDLQPVGEPKAGEPPSGAQRAVRDACKTIVELALVSHQDLALKDLQPYQCGLSKMFLNERLHLQLEQLRLDKHRRAIELIQSTVRMWLVRREFETKRRAATLLQAQWRGLYQRRLYWHQYALLVGLQRHWRRHLASGRRRRLEARRRAQRQQHQHQLRELQAQQRKQANQFRFRQQARSQQQQQQQQRPALEIPSDLAKLYRLQRDWPPVHDLSHLHQLELDELADCERRRRARHGQNSASVPFISDLYSLELAKTQPAGLPPSPERLQLLAQELEVDERYSLNHFLATYYTCESPQFGYSRLPISRPFSWPQMDILVREQPPPAMSVEEKLALLGLKSSAIYKLILRYIDSELDSAAAEQEHHLLQLHHQTSDGKLQLEGLMQRLAKFKLLADYVIYLCLEEPLLRDEIYLQLVSQSWQNPRQRSAENVWKLAANCLSCFAPLDPELTKFLLVHALDYCAARYRELVIGRLSQALALSIDEQPQPQRQLPPCMLEYWANQLGVPRMGVAVSCYMDDCAFASQQEVFVGPEEAGRLDDNMTSKTLVPVESYTSAERLAAAALSARRVPAANLAGWSVEMQHEGAQSGFSCRLRGDDLLLDHLSRVELLPDFEQLVQSGEAWQQVDYCATPGVRSTQGDGSTSAYGTESSRQFHRLSFDGSHRSYDLEAPAAEFQPPAYRQAYRRAPAASSELDLAAHLAHSTKQRRHYQAHEPAQLHHHYQRPEMFTSHRRSLSMQELQLASSALNGRYFAGGAPYYAPGCPLDGPPVGGGHYASSCVMSPAGMRRRRGSVSSLQQPRVAAGHRRSQTPTSMQQRVSSSSAYGSESRYSSQLGLCSAAYQSAGDYGPLLDGGQPRGGRSRDRRAQPAGSASGSLSRHRRPRRSASSTSRPAGPPVHTNLRPADLDQANSDYERLAPMSRQQLLQQRRLAPGQLKPQNPHLDQMKMRRPNQSTDESKYQTSHYVASSAMSDTSEAASLASHVRGIKVPQHNADLDQYLDDLFSPMLAEAELDEFSDARSLATSIRGLAADQDDHLLSASFCNAQQLSKLIRGTDDDDDHLRESATLSPTFESLLRSLKAGQGSQESAEQQQVLKTVSKQELSNMNLSELRALNERLESQIQAAQSQRPSLQELAGNPPPAPPPLPSFGAPETVDMTLEDIYSRAKTIRIGKWRWPPPAEEAATLLQPEQERPETGTPSSSDSGAQLAPPPASQPLVAATSGSVGKLKISSEMKAKLELLTNSSGSSSGKAHAEPAKLTEETGAVRKLGEQRRAMLESQLKLGAGHEQPTSGKVLQAKQQLAAAAGVALAALDSGSNASSRRQSVLEGEQRRSRLFQDELGPQSRAAISQRQAFYQLSASSEQVNSAERADSPRSEQPDEGVAAAPSLAASDNNLAGKEEQQPQGATLVRTMQMSAHLNEAGKSSALGQESERLYGQSIAKSMLQRHQESLQRSAQTATSQQQQWVSSTSPDRTRPGRGSKRASCRAAGPGPKRRQSEQGELRLVANSGPLLAYANVDWQVKIRKEFFMPSETYEDPLVVQLIFAQLVADVFNPRQWTRLNQKERAAIKALMKDNSIGYAPGLPPIGRLQTVKRDLVRMARSFGLYFTRSYPATNYYAFWREQQPLEQSSGSSEEEDEDDTQVQLQGEPDRLVRQLRRANNLGTSWFDLVAVHHSGLRLVSVVGGQAAKQAPGDGQLPQPIGYKVLETLKYRDMGQVSLIGPRELLVSMRANGKKSWLIRSDQADQLGSLLRSFLDDYNDHLSSGGLSSNGSQGRKLAGAADSTDQQDQQQQAKSRKGAAATKPQKATRLQRERANNKDALLAPDDDHHGDHIKQRQTAHSLSQLRKKTHPDDDLADNKRILSDHLANIDSPPRLGKLASSGLSPASASSPSGPSSSSSPPSSSTRPLRHSACSPSPPSTPARSPPGAPAAPGVHTLPASSQPAPVAESAPADGAISRPKTKTATSTDSRGEPLGSVGKTESRQKQASLWHNSLSRMSNKFSLFGGGAASANKIKSKANKLDTENNNNNNRIKQQQQMEGVSLDGWIETKVDFDDDELDSGEGNASHEQQDSASSQQAGSSLSPSQQVSSPAGAPTDDESKHSLLQFALHNFREAIDKYSLDSRASKVGGDTSTLRGSLKLIETLRRGGRQSSSASGSRPVGQLLSTPSGQDWTWRELAEMVKFTRQPLRHSLLKLASEDLNRRAVECFSAIMQYMCDLPAGKQQLNGEVECVYLILMNCHNFPVLRDEIYCQLMKQTTNNRSSQPESCLRGWRLFSILAAYFDCSDAFRPYLVKYLETAAYDKRRAYCSVAALCLQNLRKTFKFHGRKNVPSIEEIAATSAGRNSKRQIYRLPGGTERVINTKSTTVVEDIIQEICLEMLNVTEPDEMLEFSLYCIADGDLYTMPLNRDEYILDITTELIKNHQHYFLIFCRSIWHYPLRLDSRLYIEVIFNQIAPDYLEGLLLELPSEVGSSRRAQQLRLKAKLAREIARIAALLHRAGGTEYMPMKDEIRYLIPKPIVAAMKRASSLALEPTEAGRHSSSSSAASQASSTGADQQGGELVATTPAKWVEMVQANWHQMSALDALDAKAQFLDIVRHWPLFGSSFFAIKLIQRDLIQPMDFILALNKFGIHMLDLSSHETVHRYAFNEVISTRKVRSEDGALFLDLKCGNLMKRTIIRIQTDQAHEISRLIRQYIDIELLQQQKQSQPMTHVDSS